MEENKLFQSFQLLFGLIQALFKKSFGIMAVSGLAIQIVLKILDAVRLVLVTDLNAILK